MATRTISPPLADNRRVSESGATARLLRDLIKDGLDVGAIPAAAALLVELEAESRADRERRLEAARECGRRGAAVRWARAREQQAFVRSS